MTRHSGSATRPSRVPTGTACTRSTFSSTPAQARRTSPRCWSQVSIRKSCERACRGPTWRFAVATPVLALSARGLSGGRGPCPGAEVFGAGVPWEEAFQCRAGERFPAVAAAFVEVCGQVGQDVQPGHLGGGGDGPDDGRVPGGVPVMGAAGVFPGDDGASDHALRGVIVQPDDRVVPVGGEAVPFALQRGERFPCPTPVADSGLVSGSHNRSKFADL